MEYKFWMDFSWHWPGAGRWGTIREGDSAGGPQFRQIIKGPVLWKTLGLPSDLDLEGHLRAALRSDLKYDLEWVYHGLRVVVKESSESTRRASPQPCLVHPRGSCGEPGGKASVIPGGNSGTTCARRPLRLSGACWLRRPGKCLPGSALSHCYPRPKFK